jgi:hypothetical protein
MERLMRSSGAKRELEEFTITKMGPLVKKPDSRKTSPAKVMAESAEYWFAVGLTKANEEMKSANVMLEFDPCGLPGYEDNVYAPGMAMRPSADNKYIFLPPTTYPGENFYMEVYSDHQAFRFQQYGYVQLKGLHVANNTTFTDEAMKSCNFGMTPQLKEITGDEGDTTVIFDTKKGFWSRWQSGGGGRKRTIKDFLKYMDIVDTVSKERWKSDGDRSSVDQLNKCHKFREQIMIRRAEITSQGSSLVGVHDFESSIFVVGDWGKSKKSKG